jgi:membrane protease YdiL (CAAX protease family)
MFHEGQTLDFESSASANSATPAFHSETLFYPGKWRYFVHFYSNTFAPIHIILSLPCRERKSHNPPCVKNMISLPMRRWTMVGLALALFSMPFVIGLFTAFRVPLTTQNVLLREIILFALAGLVLLIIKRKERLGWDSVGLQRPALGNTAIWVMITFVGVALAIAVAFGFIKLFGLPVGSVDSKAYDALPTWLLLVVIIRAGFVEELFYRGYAIERLQSLTGSLIFAAGIPLVIFAVSHYRQGQAGIIIAMLTGAVLTGVYVYKRNLWITITVHFLGDFIPNILLPLFASKQ